MFVLEAVGFQPFLFILFPKRLTPRALQFSLICGSVLRLAPCAALQRGRNSLGGGGMKQKQDAPLQGRGL